MVYREQAKPLKEVFYVHISYLKSNISYIASGFVEASDRYEALQEMKKRNNISENMVWSQRVIRKEDFEEKEVI